MKLVLRPLILEASVTEMRWAVRFFRGGIFIISSHGAARDLIYGTEFKERGHYICAKPVRANSKGVNKTRICANRGVRR